MAGLKKETIDSFAAQVKQTGITLPKSSIYSSGLKSREKTVYRIKDRELYKCFLLQRGGHYTVYASQYYSSYRSAFALALKVSIQGREVDHFDPKAAVKRHLILEDNWRDAGVEESILSPDGHAFLALGAISRSANNSARDHDGLNPLINKLNNLETPSGGGLAHGARLDYDDPDFVRTVLGTGYMAPHALVRWSLVHQVSEDKLKDPLERKIFADYLSRKMTP